MKSLILATMLGLAASVHAAVPATIEVRARHLRPGEPVRIEVSASEPVVRMTGSFLGDPLALSPDASGRHWSAWSMIGLDQPPGPAVVEVRGQTAGAGELLGTRAIRIQAHDFPEERLSVAPHYVEPPAEVRERLTAERARLADLYGTPRYRSPLGAAFVRPVPGGATSAFGTRRVFNGQARDPHSGLDLRAATGTPVEASGPGLVALARDLYYSGNTVILDHGGGLYTLYAHLSEILVDEGTEVEPGQLLGRSGATGRVTGPHLHWGAKIGSRPFDPEALLDPRLFGDPFR